MLPITGKRYLPLWCVVPAAAVFVYPYVKDAPDALKWLGTSLSLLVLFFSIIVHEICHGLVSYLGGDATAQKAGRLSLNPVNHISVFGSIVLPLILFLTKAPMVLGWAKPVPLNPLELREYPKYQTATVMAGPLSNFCLAYVSFTAFICAGMIYKLLYPQAQVPIMAGFSEIVPIGDIPFAGFWYVLFQMLNMGIFINLSLGVFNLIPFPPLDGFWLLKGVLPKAITAFLTKIQIWGFVLIIIALQTKIFMIFLYPIFALGALSIALINILVG